MPIPKIPMYGALIAAAVGAGAGAYADDDDRWKGAGIGAVAGLGLATAGRMAQNIHGSYIPALFKNKAFRTGAGIAAIGGLGLGAGAFGLASSPTAVQQESLAVPTDTGYQVQPQYTNYQYSLSDRIASMNVSGDLVFGLHNKRHG